MTKKILITPAMDQFVGQKIKDRGIEPVIVDGQKEQQILEQASDVDGIILMSDPFPNSMFAKMPNLKVLARQGVGYDNVDAKFAAEQGVWVTNTPGGNATEVAESTIANMLILSKHLFTISTKMRDGDNSYGEKMMATQISGKTLGIVGYGHIGQAVAKMAAGFGMNVLVYNRTPREIEYGKQVAWDELFTKSDYVSLHLPAVKGTIGSVAKHEFEMMKDSAYLVNLGRGPLVNETDMVDALQHHHIAGAGLDVFDTEPLPMDSPIRKLDNVFMTPHCSGNSVEAWNQMANAALNNILNVLDGKKPNTPVNEVK
ncbi:phosphoglycerate dehydrogenase (plasmid) [Nicoliella spurrieriana]|uniref:Phosphoglycerate dehydrogenase n=1 Tax=Nicoliella spurrieriana TaxID=2925830 RepID=A0A976RQN0_9LACO|nr:phosphoglycerate dehydrogenase [Nicoliella spurrieriana]UQS86058.1 phosphoglycerate dehydrogenase [Nicoliella spurrieriana]